MDMGAYVIVINADKVTVTGSKFNEKTYFNHVTGRPGSYRIETFKDLQKVRHQQSAAVSSAGMINQLWPARDGGSGGYRGTVAQLWLPGWD